MVNEVRASHILVGSQAEARQLLNRIANGESFESLARKHSKCPSGRKGGDLGYFKRGMMVKEFENVAFNLEKGAISRPVKTQFGFHLIKVLDKK